jgi:hypothetical protein
MPVFLAAKMSIFNYFKPKQIVPSENSEIADLLGPSVLNEANECFKNYWKSN